MHSYRSDVVEPTCVEVFRAGYRYAGRVLRAAQVVVAEPPPASEESAAPPHEVEDDPSSAADWEPAIPDDMGGNPDSEAGSGVRVE
jgi:molecular chaperone GrpE